MVNNDVELRGLSAITKNTYNWKLETVPTFNFPFIFPFVLAIPMGNLWVVICAGLQKIPLLS